MDNNYYMKPLFGGVPVVEQHGGSHMVMTNVMKELKTKFISIDTKFRDNVSTTNTIANYNMTFPERISQVKSVSVLSVLLPLSFYNISDTLGNNTMTFMFNGTSIIKTLVIPNGQYTSSTLITAITTGLHDLNIDAVLTCSVTTGVNPGFTEFTFSPNGTYLTLHIDFYLDNTDISGNLRSVCATANQQTAVTNSCLASATASNTTGMSKNMAYAALKKAAAPNIYCDNKQANLENTLGWVLGFRQSHYLFPDITRKHSEKITSEGLLDIKTPKYLFVTLDEYSNNSHSSSFHSYIPNSLLNRHILARINLDETKTFGQYQTANLFNGLLYSDTRVYNSDSVDLQKCNIQLVNEYGDPVNLNGMDFSMVLQLKHY